MPFRIFFSILCFNFIYLFKYETIVHWVPQFFMHNKLFMWAACVLCRNYRKSHAKLAFVIPAGLLPCIYVIESALRIPRSQKKGVILLVEFQEVSVYATPARTHSISHGGLYRWRENSLPIFLFQKLKEILTRYSRTILTDSKKSWFPKFEGCGSKIEPATPLNFEV